MVTCRLPAEGARRASAAHGRSWAVACGFLGDTARLTWSQPASGHVTCDDFSSQERLSGSSRVASFAPRHTPTRTTLSLISPSRSATHTHTCVVATSPKRMSYVAHPSSRRMRFQLVPCGRKQKQRLRRKERSHGKFSSDAAFFCAGTNTRNKRYFTPAETRYT